MTLRSNLKLFCLFLALLLLAAPLAHAQIAVLGDGGPGPVKAPHLTVELVSVAPAIAPGGTLQTGLLFTLEENWHVYWINAGDSGDPPKATWTLPTGITAGPMQFPIPSRLPLGPLMDFGYEDSVAFPIELTAAKSVKPGPTHIDALVSWLVCREVCIPGKAKLGLNLNVDTKATAPEQPLGALGEALKLIPQPPPPSMKFSVTGGKEDFVLTFITGTTVQDAEFYPFDQEQITNAAPQNAEIIPNGVRLRIKRAETLKTLPANLHGLLKLSDEKAYDVTAPVVPGEVPIAAPAVDGKKATVVTTATAIGLAFLGGIILNLMPCVFPVLFLKGLSLVQSSDQERHHQRSHGLVYTLGILVSFWAIVAVLLILRAGGTQAGWGFQLQSPTFIVLLAAGLFFFALSLAGQFELGLSLTSVGGGLAQKQGYTGSFFTGVLATVVATPCTAPLMGAAVGFALAQPAAIAFAVFTALGLGLAAPYLLLTLNPGWTRILPRPGAWMETLKQLSSVLLFGTVIWLVWVYGSLYSAGGSAGTSSLGIDRIAHLLWGLLAIAIAGWVLGRWPAKIGSTIAAVILIAVGLTFPLYQPKDTTLTWAPYSQKALDDARAAGHPVFIDFTAAWCLSCQVNERAVLRSDDVQHQFASHKFTLLKADWTQYDPEITKQLTAVNRQGVPTYVVYPANPQAMPDVLPELLTKSIVLDALQKDTQTASVK
jgi:thiol:disulfide interchange protein DsbD